MAVHGCARCRDSLCQLVIRGVILTLSSIHMDEELVASAGRNGGNEEEIAPEMASKEQNGGGTGAMAKTSKLALSKGQLAFWLFMALILHTVRGAGANEIT